MILDTLSKPLTPIASRWNLSKFVILKHSGREILHFEPFVAFLAHGYSVGVFVSHRHHSISISAFFCVLIASSLLCAPGGNRLDQSRTSLVDFSREPVRPVYTLDLLFTCWNLHCENSSAFAEKEFIPVTFLSYTCNYYNRLYLTGTLQRLACIAATISFLTSVSADNIPFL